MTYSLAKAGWLISLIALLPWTNHIADAQTTAPPPGSSSKPAPTRGAAEKVDPKRVLASVGDRLITQADVDLALGRTASGRNDLPAVPEPVLMASVEIIAQRRQALESLKKTNKRVSDAAIDKWLLENSPPDLKLTAAQALKVRAEAAQVTPENYREFLAFRLSWQAYLQTALNDKNLEKHFQNQKARFDGSTYEVEHVWVTTPPGKSEQRDAAHKQLAKLRQQVIDGKLTMQQVGEQLLGPDADTAARAQATKDVGPLLITGSGPLMPRIVDYVLKTPEGELTQPFDSASAVHLVRVVKTEVGKKTLAEAQDDVRRHMLVYLLEFLAAKSADELPLKWRQ